LYSTHKRNECKEMLGYIYMPPEILVAGVESGRNVEERKRINASYKGKDSA